MEFLDINYKGRSLNFLLLVLKMNFHIITFLSSLQTLQNGNRNKENKPFCSLLFRLRFTAIQGWYGISCFSLRPLGKEGSRVEGVRTHPLGAKKVRLMGS